MIKNIRLRGIQEAICIWGVTRLTIFAVTRITTEARAEIRGGATNTDRE